MSCPPLKQALLTSADIAADYEADGKFIENQGPQLVKLFPKFRLKKYLKHLILPAESDTPLQLYTKRVGFNNIVVSMASPRKGKLV